MPSVLRIIGLWLLCSMSLSTQAAAPQQDSLEMEFARVTRPLYSQRAQSPDALTLAQVQAACEQAYANKQYTAAVQIIQAHQALIATQLNQKAAQKLISLALRMNAVWLVDAMLDDAEQNADSYAAARLRLALAGFFAHTANWTLTLKALSDDALFEQLPVEDSAEAYLLAGTALQKIKKHREAMKRYEKIKADLPQYRLAQLNLATANLRQEWWTDAQIAINAALKNNTDKRDELDYRLYTVLGFSQLQFGFYRDARESFRNIALSSRYAQRALLGLGMAALHQEDFIGALNAFDKLAAQDKYDISVAESHLLRAFTLRQLRQYDAATAAYQVAIDYYQQLSAQIAVLQVAGSTTPVRYLRAEHTRDNQLGDYAQKLALLRELKTQTAGSGALAALENRVQQAYSRRALLLLAQEKSAVDSYLSQSQYGLASLYDQR